MTAPQTGYADYLEGTAGPANVLIDGATVGAGTIIVGVFDVRAYRTLIVDLLNLAAASASVVFQFYADPAATEELNIRQVVLNAADIAVGAIPCLGPFVQVVVSATNGIAAINADLTVTASGGDMQSWQTALASIVFQSVGVNVAGGGGVETVTTLQQYDGLLRLQIDTASPTWTANIQAMDQTGAFTNIGTMRSTDSLPATLTIQVPNVPLQVNVTNNDAAAHIFNVYGSIGG
jgi:hypothetical protein